MLLFHDPAKSHSVKCSDNCITLYEAWFNRASFQRDNISLKINICKGQNNKTAYIETESRGPCILRQPVQPEKYDLKLKVVLKQKDRHIENAQVVSMNDWS